MMIESLLLAAILLYLGYKLLVSLYKWGQSQLTEAESTVRAQLPKRSVKQPPAISTDRLEIAPSMAANKQGISDKQSATHRMRRKLNLKQGVMMKELLDDPRARNPWRPSRFKR